MPSMTSFAGLNTQANRDLRANQRPFYQVPSFVKQAEEERIGRMMAQFSEKKGEAIPAQKETTINNLVMIIAVEK